MHAETSQLVLLRYSGDVSTKARATRFQFVRRLLQNVRDALASEGLKFDVEVTHERLLVKLPADADPAVLTRIFGVQSISVVEREPLTELADIVAAGAARYRDAVRGKRFAVRARRVGNRARIPARSGQVERELGTALLPGAAGVDLGNPEITVRVEMLEQETYFFPEITPAPAGLPLGVEGRAVALVSGGFDSAVAAWQLLKRGVSLDYVFCNLGGVTHEQGVLRVMKVVADRWSYGDQPRLHAIDFAAVSEDLQRHSATRYWQVILKRLMLRAAERIAADRRAAAIVTGDAVGQVSSQTLQNLSVISNATSQTILRPLVGFNKEEILSIARRIGTFDLSKVVGEYCAMVPRKPATAAALDVVLAEEAKLDRGILERAVAARRVIDLRSLDIEKLELPDLEVERVPEAADVSVIDLRTRAEYETWHHEGALRLEFPKALSAYASFDRSKRYVLYCEIGLKSAHLAELMRAEGFEAHHVRAGVRTLQRAEPAAGEVKRA